ncbi:MAG: peptide-methionine (S)-S-oxide reductase MsrA [Rickettsiales bacterium]|nr:peptide-methionine (S)-S-oxide reductase MsrA [Rickettsiales bacterium]
MSDNANAENSNTDKSNQNYEIATLAAGCFWCIESDLEKVDGIISVVSGYTGGHTTNPTYKQVSRGKTGHTEAVRVTFDPSIISYEELLDLYWVNSDPTTIKGQFCDIGPQYRPEIFYHDEQQKIAAESSKVKAQQKLKVQADILTPITAASEFYEAEGYHQNYYTKNPLRYKFYRSRCGRDKRLKQLW